jgi:hypothetical protein
MRTLSNIMLPAATLAAMGCLSAASQKTFSSPEEAVQAVIQAAEKNDTSALLQLFGPAGKDIVESGDADEDKTSRAHFAQLARQRKEIHKDPSNPDKIIVSIGTEDWPFPVPLVRQNGAWRFDSAETRVEILARRIGANEMNAMEVCRGYVEAQMEYAAQPRNGSKVLQYAQRIDSSPGKQEGLYWEPSSGAPEPIVPKALAEAAAANYGKPGFGHYHGYYFRVLKSQGPDASGGAFNYIVNGSMIGGFALVAWPAEYAVSGVRTFIISHQGILYEKDLGPNTTTLARQMTRFNPDKTWRPVSQE